MNSWIVAHNVISPLGLTANENYESVRNGKSGIKNIGSGVLASTIEPGYLPAIHQTEKLKDGYTYFEQLIIHSAKAALTFSSINPSSSRAIFILSTTKGNIDLLEGDHRREQLLLSYSAKVLATYFNNPNKPVVVSNACISGIMALLVAKRLLESNQFDHAIVVGADVVSKFVVAGFQSLSAMSASACKPFDKNRTGISLGEAAATVIVSRDQQAGAISNIQMMGGGLSNDANHISGPSKTGEELSLAISKALQESNFNIGDIDFISAHGTATLYNDEMEAKAFAHAGLVDKPINSLKGSFGHTLGAAGLVESVMSIEGLLNNEVLPTVGFECLGVSSSLAVSSHVKKMNTNVCLKTGSGFGGCNAAVIFQKVNS